MYSDTLKATCTSRSSSKFSPNFQPTTTSWFVGASRSTRRRRRCSWSTTAAAPSSGSSPTSSTTSPPDRPRQPSGPCLGEETKILCVLEHHRPLLASVPWSNENILLHMVSLRPIEGGILDTLVHQVLFFNICI